MGPARVVYENLGGRYEEVGRWSNRPLGPCGEVFMTVEVGFLGPKFGKSVQIWKVYGQDRARDVMPPPPGRDEILYKGLVHHHHTHNSHYMRRAQSD